MIFVGLVSLMVVYKSVGQSLLTTLVIVSHSINK